MWTGLDSPLPPRHEPESWFRTPAHGKSRVDGQSLTWPLFISQRFQTVALPGSMNCGESAMSRKKRENAVSESRSQQLAGLRLAGLGIAAAVVVFLIVRWRNEN